MDPIKTSWANVKSFLDSRGLSAQYHDFGSYYYILGIDGGFSVATSISKTDPAGSDQTDFETNYKTSANKSPITSVLQNTGKKPTSLRIAGDTWTCSANSTTVHHVPIASGGRRMRGGEFQFCGAYEAGAWAKVELEDVDGVLGAGPNFIVPDSDYISKFCIYKQESGQNAIVSRVLDPDTSDQISDLLYLRITVHNPQASQDIQAIINFWLYKDV